MKKDILIIILIIVVLGLGGYLVFDNILDKKVENPTIEDNNNEQENDVVDKENNSNNTDNGVVDGEVSNNSTQLKNYNVNNIKNIEIEVPVKNADGPEKKKVIITDKEEMKSILLNVDEAKEIGNAKTEVGYESNVTIKVNYNGDPSTLIIIMSNGNLAINKAVGVGETGYGEYEISNKNLAVELTNKYQN